MNVELHSNPDNSSSPSNSNSPPKACNLCNFIAKNKSGFHLHFFRKHKDQIIPPALSFADQLDEISTFPSSSASFVPIQEKTCFSHAEKSRTAQRQFHL
ncbi:hypothetical protein NPIL_586491 [Nephila pilipes]|uniref:Uncharacterized protein n=1 Tax=Nephila pilipes TaxID=299642 RepID=A0A8X6JGW5_NEPPI|nr:hypothetical protein NPIL_586491 [Nephila pilipes]